MTASGSIGRAGGTHRRASYWLCRFAFAPFDRYDETDALALDPFAALPASSNRACRRSLARCRSARSGSTKSNTTASASSAGVSATGSACSLAVVTTGPTGCPGSRKPWPRWPAMHHSFSRRAAKRYNHSAAMM
jgi:hypothetical protein